ncbi:hypothetical protein [Flavobacterium columnare]|uniref:Uncharacterized protein n=1 Tax=Flavobacterium columnare TaxID=996 RepID=A0AAI8GB95_9FLAO|nr:hypothetical protein [Flavobacterium columnare]AMO20728.1 hypothetical protein UN65_10615 [Flavobacterium columnare]AUX18709.1 hypothetical protein AQ623_10775 [Flavobacterium columnare]QOG57791.1 hypothetical protein HUE29_10680 [Flavobacterium columnare]QOG60515.1 hypothetical protein HUE30_10680 [Flavobacterium columnare]QOG63235.1 hypothetical protein HUE31_10680 [Flavobacterium columnare]
MIQKNLNSYPLEYQVQILREILMLEYPFELQDLIDYESNLDFNIISKNHQIHWSIEILKHFKDKWDWVAIQSNPFVYSYCNIGLFLSEYVKQKPFKCKCDLKLEFCSKDQLCIPNYDYILLRPTNINPLHEKFTNWVKHLIEERFFNSISLGHFLLYDNIIEDINDYVEDKAPARNNDVIDSDFNEDEVPF